MQEKHFLSPRARPLTEPSGLNRRDISNFETVLSIKVINRESSLELGMFLFRRSHFFVIIDKTINKRPSCIYQIL